MFIVDYLLVSALDLQLVLALDGLGLEVEELVRLFLLLRGLSVELLPCLLLGDFLGVDVGLWGLTLLLL